MKQYKLTSSLLFFALISISQSFALPISLDSCHTLALQHNKELAIAGHNITAAHYDHQSAITNYLPSISASAAYIRSNKEFSLLSNDQKAMLPHLGDALAMPSLNNIGQNIVDALHTDTRNISAISVMLTQPIYMGGKIRAYDRITQYAEDIARDRRSLKYQEIIVQVDETYWTIVALVARKNLALSYKQLVDSLDHDMQHMIIAGLATKADGLSVKVKVNEADVAIIQIDNAIDVLKLRLCELCGLNLSSDITLDDENIDLSVSDIINEECFDANSAQLHRPEIKALSSALKISDEKIKIARAEFLPSLALFGGYMATNPAVLNGFEKKLSGTWNIGLMLNVPIVTSGNRFFKVNASKARAVIARLELDDTREKIELQVSQAKMKLREANARFETSRSSLRHADENLRHADIGFKEGVIPVINVIEAQTAWLAARANVISAAIDIRLANVYLKKSLGKIE